MTNPGGRLWVDPEGVVSVGHAYAEHAALYDRYLRQLASLRERYSASWGDDEMGTKFSTKFLAGLDNLEGLIRGVQGTLEFTAQALRSSGRLYRTVDDEAAEVSLKLAGDIEGHPPPGTLSGIRDPGEYPPSTETHLVLAVRAPTEKPLRKLLPMEQGTRRLMPMAPGSESQPSMARGTRWLLPMARGIESPIDSVPPEPAPFDQTHQLTPAISTRLVKREFLTAHIDGVPLAEGYRLECFGVFPDGTARLDVNRYESVSPVGQLPVTTVDGHPIDPEGGQLFVVKENPNVDPTEPGYQPLYVGFTSDGTPIPLVTSLR